MKRPDSGHHWQPSWSPTDDPVENSLRRAYLRANLPTAKEQHIDDLLAELTEVLRKPQEPPSLRQSA